MGTDRRKGSAPDAATAAVPVGGRAEPCRPTSRHSGHAAGGDASHVAEALRVGEASRLALAEEREAHIRFLESLDRVDRAIGGAVDLEQMMRDVLDELLDIFGCDRAWLVYPCNPEAPTWKPLMERTRPEYPGALTIGEDLPMDPEVAATFRQYLASTGPVAYGPGTERPLPDELARRHRIQSFVAIALRPRSGEAWAFGLHQCSYGRTWTPEELRLFEEIGRRLGDGLSNLLAYRQLARTEQRLRLALRAGTTGAIDIDLETGRGAWTSEVASICGFPADYDGSLIDLWLAQVHPEDLDRVRAGFLGLTDRAMEYETEFRIRRPDGHVRWVRWRGEITGPADGTSRHVIGVVVDITEGKVAAERLRATEAQYRRIVDTASEGVWVQGASGETTFVNARMTQIVGYDAEELLARPLVDFLVEDDIEDHARRMAARRRGIAETYERRLRHRDGHIVWAQVSATPIIDAEGRYGGSFGMMTDITERKRAEETVQALNGELAVRVMQYRALLDQASDAIFVSDAERCYVDVNEAACSMLGYERDELIGLHVADVVPPELNVGQEDRFTRMLAGESILTERTMRRKDGSLIQAELSTRRLRDGRYQAIARDITARKRFEADQVRLAAAVEQADEAIVITDPSATILYVNPALERVSGYGRDELVGANPRVLSSGEQDAAFYREMWSTLRAGRTWRGTFTNRTKGGQLYTEDSVISPIHGPDGALVAYVGAKRDVTRERSLESQLRQTQKMHAIGQLAGGIAHDFNNLITAIRGYGEMAREGLPPGSAPRADLDQVILAANRAADLTRQLLAFSRRQVLEPQVLDPSAVVAGIVPMLRRLIGENIDLTTQASPSPLRVRVDPSQLEQVIVNLVVNARDAMPEGGRLTIETAQADSDGSPLSWVAIRVADTGCGMDAETQSHAFEPFFTTKDLGRGTGMGLATVYGIVDQSGGRIRITSEPGRGTSVEVLLPRVDEPQVQANEAEAADPIPRGTETILLAEDEDGVRDVARRSLEALGYRVLDARDGLEAIAMLDTRADVDLLVTDLVMPKLGGRDLMARVRRSRPGLPVLVISGFVDVEPITDEPGSESPVLLTKPFTAGQLARAVRAALASSPRLSSATGQARPDRRETTGQAGASSSGTSGRASASTSTNAPSSHPR